jgi:probable rRNA maturation factor
MRVAGASEVRVSGAAEGLEHAARAGASRVMRQERSRGRVAITFVGKRQMRSLNADHLGHDYCTDVISFALPQPDGTVAGDIYICRYMAARNARTHGVRVREEVIRLAIHGTLHVLGWDHPGGAARVRSPMWRRQERYVADLR